MTSKQLLTIWQSTASIGNFRLIPLKLKLSYFPKVKYKKNIFTYNKITLDILDNYTYYNGKFKIAVEKLILQVDKAMLSLLCKGRKLNLQTDIMLYLFDSLVKPILLHGSEVWGTDEPTYKYG